MIEDPDEWNFNPIKPDPDKQLESIIDSPLFYWYQREKQFWPEYWSQGNGMMLLGLVLTCGKPVEGTKSVFPYMDFIKQYYKPFEFEIGLRGYNFIPRHIERYRERTEGHIKHISRLTCHRVYCFKCLKCDHEFDLEQTDKNNPTLPEKCPKCNRTSGERLIAGNGTSFKILYEKSQNGV